jgi:hypothetical protein
MLGFGTPLSWFTEGTGGDYIPVEEAISGTPPRLYRETGWVNNVAFETLGMRMVQHGGWMTSGSTPPVQPRMMPGTTGGRYAGLQSTAPLQLALEGNFLEVNVDNRVAAANLCADALRGLLEVRFADAPDRVIRGMAGPVQFTPLTNTYFTSSHRAGVVRASIPITCVDSARYARHARQIVLGTTPVPVPLGSLASGGDIYIFAEGETAVDVELYSHTGLRTHVLALRSVDIPEDGFARVRIDAPHAVLAYDAAGEATSVAHWRSLTLSSRWWKPSPYYADAPRALWPLMRLSVGTGVYRYHQAWEH